MSKNHQPPDARRWIIAAGDNARYERKPTDYPGWLWCTNGEGQSAWAPENWVAILSSTHCRFKRDYDAFELKVTTGELVDSEIEESGWILVKNKNGKSGWIPLDCVHMQLS